MSFHKLLRFIYTIHAPCAAVIWKCTGVKDRWYSEHLVILGKEESPMILFYEFYRLHWGPTVISQWFWYWHFIITWLYTTILPHINTCRWDEMGSSCCLGRQNGNLRRIFHFWYTFGFRGAFADIESPPWLYHWYMIAITLLVGQERWAGDRRLPLGLMTKYGDTDRLIFSWLHRRHFTRVTKLTQTATSR